MYRHLSSGEWLKARNRLRLELLLWFWTNITDKLCTALILHHRLTRQCPSLRIVGSLPFSTLWVSKGPEVPLVHRTYCVEGFTLFSRFLFSEVSSFKDVFFNFTSASSPSCPIFRARTSPTVGELMPCVGTKRGLLSHNAVLFVATNSCNSSQ